MKKFDENNILTLNILSSLVIIMFLVLSLGFFFLYNHYKEYKKESENLESDAISRRVEQLKPRVDDIVRITLSEMESANDYAKNSIKQDVYSAFDTADLIYKKYRGTEDDDKIKERIIDATKKYHSDISSEGLFIYKLNGYSILNQRYPQYENKNLYDVGNDEVDEILRKEKKLIINKGEGFIYSRYGFFMEKNKMKNNYFQLVFLKKFPPYDWVIGSSFSIYSITEYAKNSVLDMLKKGIFIYSKHLNISILQINDLNGGDKFAKVLVDNKYPQNNGSYISDNIVDANGKEYVKDYLADLRNDGSSHFEYYKENSENNKDLIVNNIKLVEEWGWLISVSADMSDIGAMINDRNKLLKDKLFSQIAIVFLLLVFFGGFAFFISYFFSEVIRRIFSNYKGKINKKTSELEFVNAEMEHQLYYDSLTGLLNINRLYKDLDSLTVDNRYFLLMVLELNNFDYLNDYYGLAVGKEIIQLFSSITKEIIHKDMYQIYKYKTSSLLVLCVGDEKLVKESVYETANIYLDHVNKRSFKLPTKGFEIDLNIISAVVPGKYDNIMEVVGMALEEAKRKKLSYIFFENYAETLNEYEYVIIWSKKVKDAIQKDRIVPYFQPILNAGKIGKYECLMRLIDEDGTVIAPGFFLDITMRSNLYFQLTKIMINKCFEYFKERDYQFSINLSIEDILNDSMVDFIISKLDEYGIGEKLIFEIVESGNINDYESVNNFINKVSRYGVQIAIDDFGSGYANYVYIVNLDISYIKIDGSLIKNLDSDESAKIIVQSIIYFADQLKIPTIAEYVHSESIYKITKELGIKYFQGYYLGGPAASIE